MYEALNNYGKPYQPQRVDANASSTKIIMNLERIEREFKRKINTNHDISLSFKQYSERMAEASPLPSNHEMRQCRAITNSN